jgi:hypothetical protein
MDTNEFIVNIGHEHIRDKGTSIDYIEELHVNNMRLLIDHLVKLVVDLVNVNEFRMLSPS